MIRVKTDYQPAIRYLKSSGYNQHPDGVFMLSTKGIYGLQAKLHRRADGSCLKFSEKEGEIKKCEHYPGPYEGKCLEVFSGGPGGRE